MLKFSIILLSLLTNVVHFIYFISGSTFSKAFNLKLCLTVKVNKINQFYSLSLYLKVPFTTNKILQNSVQGC